MKLATEHKIETINRLLQEVRAHKAAHADEKLAYCSGPGSILNAYREGDLTFDQAVAEIEQLGQG